MAMVEDRFSRMGVAIVGTGFGLAVHLPALRHCVQGEVVALYHHDRQRARELAAHHGIPKGFGDLDTLLADPEVDAVTIATPPFLHFPMAQQAILAGKHVLLEKPVTLNVQEAVTLHRLAQDRGVKVAVNFEFRFVPAWQYLAQLLAQGEIGTLRLVKGDWLVSSRASGDRPWNWYAQREKGGGVLGAVGSHSFDYLHWVFGPAQRLFAQVNCAIPERPDPLENQTLKPVTAEDTALIHLQLAGGIPCALALSSVTYGGRGHWLEIYGDRGSLRLGSDNLKDYVHGFKLWHCEAGKSWTELTIPHRLAFPEVFADGRIAPVIRVMNQWLDAICQNSSPCPGLNEGIYSQLLMDLCYRSHALEQWVSVPTVSSLLGNQGNPVHG